VYYYFLLQGEHPFGDGYEREANIINGSHKLLLGEDRRNGRDGDRTHGTVGTDGTDGMDRNIQLKRKYPDCYDLLTRMLAQDNSHLKLTNETTPGRRRPTITQVKSHPFFWNNSKRVDFLIQFSDLIEHYVSLANTNNTNNVNNANNTNRVIICS